MDEHKCNIWHVYGKLILFLHKKQVIAHNFVRPSMEQTYINGEKTMKYLLNVHLIPI
jgi:hypothetical protein